jgi:hypothetical protein
MEGLGTFRPDGFHPLSKSTLRTSRKTCGYCFGLPGEKPDFTDPGIQSPRRVLARGHGQLNPATSRSNLSEETVDGL